MGQICSFRWNYCSFVQFSAWPYRTTTSSLLCWLVICWTASQPFDDLLIRSVDFPRSQKTTCVHTELRCVHAFPCSQLDPMRPVLNSSTNEVALLCHLKCRKQRAFIPVNVMVWTEVLLLEFLQVGFFSKKKRTGSWWYCRLCSWHSTIGQLFYETASLIYFCSVALARYYYLNMQKTTVPRFN